MERVEEVKEEQTHRFHICAKAGDSVSILELHGTHEAHDAGDAVAQFIREKFRFADGSPVKLIQLDSLTIEHIED